MGRRPNDPTPSRRSLLILSLLAFAACGVAYVGFTSALRRPSVGSAGLDSMGASGGEEGEECCRGIENLELWGSAVKWGTDLKLNSSAECCRACKEMCKGEDGPCLCDSWVFCGDRERCKQKFGECWLKKQKDSLFPDLHGSGEEVMWTSGLIFGRGEGIVGLETEYGTLHIKLFPDCAPHSVAFIMELLGARHCAGCQLHRAESRGDSWDLDGNHRANARLGPPYGLLQGTLEAEGIIFKGLPKEACPAVRRGSVAWVGSGPEFIISLANHNEWRRAYTVFGSVLPEDMHIAEKIASLPTKSDVWNGVEVLVLKDPVPLKLKRVVKSGGDLSLNSHERSKSKGSQFSL